MTVILALLMDITPDYVTCTTNISAMVDLESGKIVDKLKADKNMHYCNYLNFDYLAGKVVEWEENLDLFKEDVLPESCWNNEYNLIIVHPSFEEPVGEFLERLSLIRGFEVGGIYFTEQEDDEHLDYHPFSLPVKQKISYKSN